MIKKTPGQLSGGLACCKAGLEAELHTANHVGAFVVH